MGLLRLFLALSVIAAHAQTTVFGFDGLGGWPAVNFFFIISGFYMAMVLNGKYKDTSPILFYKSRAFRLFPAYYVGLLLAVLVSFPFIHFLYFQLSTAGKLYYIFENTLIFGQDLSYLFCLPTADYGCAHSVAMTINPPAWSLAVEFGFYLIAPYVVKSEKRTFAFVLFGCAYLLALNGLHFPIDQAGIFRPLILSDLNVFFYPSSFIFFGAGAMAYHLSKRRLEPHYFAAIFAIVLLAFTQTIVPSWQLLLVSMAIPVLFDYTAKNRIDRTIGELSYPTYILHYPILLFVKPFTISHPQYFTYIGLGSWVTILSCSMGFLVYHFIEKKISRYRQSKSFFEEETPSKRKFRVRISTMILAAYLLFPLVAISCIYLAS